MFSRRPRLASPTISRTDWPSGVRSELRCGIRSSSVKTACTPGAARAARVSMPLTVAWACGERTNTADSVPGSAMSSMKRPLPVSSAGSSTRAVRAPKLILAVLMLVQAWSAAQVAAAAARARLPSQASSLAAAQPAVRLPTFEDRCTRPRAWPCPLVASGPVRRVTPLERFLSEDRDAAKQPPLTRIEICACVQGTAVVPQHEVTWTPNMFVDKAPLLLVVK